MLITNSHYNGGTVETFTEDQNELHRELGDRSCTLRVFTIKSAQLSTIVLAIHPE